MMPAPLQLAAALALSLQTLDGGSFVPPPGEMTVLLFWRADCPPCLIELRHAQDYVEAAAPGHVLFVGLQEPAPLARAAARLGLPETMVVRAPVTVLSGLGKALPLSVALDGAGAVCARQEGLLGLDRLRAWKNRCGGNLARD